LSVLFQPLVERYIIPPLPRLLWRTFEIACLAGGERLSVRGKGLSAPSGHHGPSVIILAAGGSVRFAGVKQLAEIGGRPLVEWVLEAVPRAEVRETVVVLGHAAPEIAGAIGARKGVSVVINHGYRTGLAGSIRAGVLALAKGTDGAMLLLADQPFVSRSLLRRMLRVFESGGARGKIVGATLDGTVTPPVIFSRTYFRELAGLKGDQGARSVVERHRASLSLVRVRAKAELADIDTREDLGRARATRALRSLGGGEPGFAPPSSGGGPFRRARRTRSLRRGS
jgi:molybdenum cofactor cytidylyltransferase